MSEQAYRIIELIAISASAIGTFYACWIAVNNSNRSSEEQTALTMLRCIS